jgi:ring-1,2-phenylacetyl-CoA epoxidase subunit PaaC
METTSNLSELDQTLREALANKLLALADDELILAHRDSEWTGHAPILEEDIAFANIAQDELGHALRWYGLLGGADPDRLVYFRPPAEFRNAQFVELPKGDWAFNIVRQYLFDAFELLRSELMETSAYRPLAEAAAKVRQEERYHYRHTSAWLTRLGQGTEESHRRTQAALDALWPYIPQLFTAVPDEELLFAAGMVPAPAQVLEAWQELVFPLLTSAALRVPERSRKIPPGRDEHTVHLAPLVADLQQVARLDPEAEW